MKNAIEKNLINNYSKLHEYMGSSKITKTPVDWFDWKIDQFGSVNYKDSIQLSINEDRVKVKKKPFFWSKESALYEANKALEHLKSTYEKLFFYDKDANIGGLQ